MSETKRARKPAKKTRKPRKKAAAPKKARKAAAKAPKKVTVRLPPQPPPGTPVIPCDDALVGQEFSVRECRTVPKRGGGTKRSCDTQRVVVVGCATPSADHPKRKQLFAVQAGQRFNIPDREIHRDLRDAQRVRERYGDGAPAPAQLPAGPSCDDLRETVLRGGEVPADAYRRCGDLPDHVPPASGGDDSFDFGGSARSQANPYSLYDMPGRDEATREIAEAIRNPDLDDAGVTAVLDKWGKFGVTDTESHWAIKDDFQAVRGRELVEPRWWEGMKPVPKGHVRVIFENAAGQSRGEIVTDEVYRMFPIGELVTLTDVRRAAAGHPAHAHAVVAPARHVQRLAPGQSQGAFKFNHHDGHHEPGDPLGIYMPPVEQWQRDRSGPGTWEWIHPQLGWSFVVRYVSPREGYTASVSTTTNRYGYHRVVTAKGKGAVQFPIYAGRSNVAKGLRSWTEGHKALRSWYASVRPGALDDRAQREREYAAGSYQRAAEERQRMEERAASEERWRLGMIDAGRHFHDYTVHEHGVVSKHNGADAAYPMPRMSFPKANGLAAGRGTFSILRGRNVVATYVADSGNHALRAYLDENPHADPSRYHAVLVTTHKHNPPKGLAPGQTYTDRRADPLAHQRVSGDGYAGEVRTRAVGCDPQVPSHIVGGKVLPRSKVAAGVRREEIRRGLRPAPPPRPRPARAPLIEAVSAPQEVAVYQPQEVYAQPAPEVVYVQPEAPQEVYAQPAASSDLSDDDLVSMFSQALRR